VCDDVQLVAQAMCLEFMMGKAVAEGAIFYATSKRRRVVPVTAQLRQQVKDAAQAIRRMFALSELPAPLGVEQAVKRCKGCSLIERCQPQATRAGLAAALVALFDPDV
jgi:CRISPR-associated exonuclease Cas4